MPQTIIKTVIIKAAAVLIAALMSRIKDYVHRDTEKSRVRSNDKK